MIKHVYVHRSSYRAAGSDFAFRCVRCDLICSNSGIRLLIMNTSSSHGLAYGVMSPANHMPRSSLCVLSCCFMSFHVRQHAPNEH